jgi:tRNA modification GTPase
VEAHIDFPDEDIDPETGAALVGRIDSIGEEIARLLRTASQGEVLREGLRTVIVGAPNAGKSSLLNRLLGYERAIVSHLPGTTRDTLEEVVNIRGIPVRLIDTAGIRPSQDLLENAGIERTRHALSRAGLILRVVDASEPPAATDEAPSAAANTILVLNKCDLGVCRGWEGTSVGVRVSCKTGEGFDLLTQAIFDSAMKGGGTPEDFMIAINARQQVCLKSAAASLEAARCAMEEAVSPEFVAIDLRAAVAAIGEVAGRLDAEELLGEIFSRFCIGK